MRGFGYKYAVLALLCSSAATLSLHAQQVSGHTHDAASGAPIPGAVVALLDSSGKTLARTISGTDGQYRLVANGSAAIVRALRIGFRPVSRDLAHTAADAAITVDFEMSTLPVVLDTIAVRSQAECAVRSDGTAAFALWDQARDALLASVVAQEARPANLRVLLYDRAYEGRTERIRKLYVTDSVFTASQPLVSVRSGVEYQTLGFMDNDSTQLHQKFYLPVAEVLLDSSFVQTHCLSVRHDDSHHASELGLAFEPTKKKDSIVDVSGVIWIARTNPELRSLEFEYTRLPANLAPARPGGRLEFRTLPNGIVMSTKWFAHIPELAVIPMRLGRQTIGAARTLIGTHDIGGEVAEASWPDGFRWRDSLGVIRGQVVGDDGGAPIDGAFVRLVGTTFQTNTDSAGGFFFPPTVRGPYQIEAVDTALAKLGVLPRTTTDLTLGDRLQENVRVKLPSRAKSVRTVCSAATKDEPGVDGGDYLLVGRVSTTTGAPANDAFVNMQWAVMVDGHRQVVRGVAKSDSAGRFEFCGVPLATEILLNASHETLVSSEARFVVDSTKHLINMPLTLTSVELANLPAYRKRKVVVTDASSLTPLSDVDVIDIFDDATIGKTNAQGILSLAALPGGLNFLRLRKLGYEQRIERYRVDSVETGDIRVQLRTVAQLATVKVTAAAAVTARAEHDGFEDRLKQGIGHFLLPKDFDQDSGKPITALISRLGIRLVGRGAITVMSGGHSSSGYCPVTIYIDGMVWWQASPGAQPPNVYDFQTDDFAAAEYYSSAAEVPPQYNPTRPSPCGTLVLWRRE
jgi:hypothetical protein